MYLHRCWQFNLCFLSSFSQSLKSHVILGQINSALKEQHIQNFNSYPPKLKIQILFLFAIHFQFTFENSAVHQHPQVGTCKFRYPHLLQKHSLWGKLGFHQILKVMPKVCQTFYGFLLFLLQNKTTKQDENKQTNNNENILMTSFNNVTAGSLVSKQNNCWTHQN